MGFIVQLSCQSPTGTKALLWWEQFLGSTITWIVLVFMICPINIKKNKKQVVFLNNLLILLQCNKTKVLNVGLKEFLLFFFIRENCYWKPHVPSIGEPDECNCPSDHLSSISWKFGSWFLKCFHENYWKSTFLCTYTLCVELTGVAIQVRVSLSKTQNGDVWTGWHPVSV